MDEFMEEENISIIFIAVLLIISVLVIVKTCIKIKK
jgi:hypothetical protein